MNRITFKINGVEHSVGSEVTSDVTLLDYIRNYVELRGTKYMCREAGCGACIVSAVKVKDTTPVAVNACMVSVTSCHDWDITTVEKVGNKLDGYHPLQTTLAKYHGSQCGYCSPGWIMAMYSLQQRKEKLTMLEIEKSFGSNVCRCTGYRPILEAFKQFASDAPHANKIPDIEDLLVCKKNGIKCAKKENCGNDDWCFISNDDFKQSTITVIELKDGKKWYKVQSLADIFQVLDEECGDSYMLISGNTAKGAYPIEEYPNILIDISSVAELKGHKIDQDLIIGSGTTLTEALDIFQEVAKEDSFAYLQKLYDHLSQVAHIAVRNLGSIAGNLMIKHQHNEFPSDIFLLLETVGAQMTLKNSSSTQTLTMEKFLDMNMEGWVILNVLLPPLSSEYKLVTYKIMPRAQNAHAIVNAGFLYKFEDKDDLVTDSRIVFGGLSPSFIRASKTEGILVGKKLFDNDTLQSAIDSLKGELVATDNPPEPSGAYRKQLAINLFYKGLLSLCPKSMIDARYQSGAINLRETRPVSCGEQKFDTDPLFYPLTEPIEKLEALIQCAGEAPYTEDLPKFPREVFAAFVLSTVPNGTIGSMDASAALKQPRVIQFYSAKDIPGLNSFTPADAQLFTANEEVLCSCEVKYFNQPIGIIVAETRIMAERAAKMVDVTYSNTTKPVIDITEAKNDSNRNTLFKSFDAKDKGTDVVKEIKNSYTMDGQYHFTMENLVCVTIPSEEGLEVHAATQHLDGVQLMISRALKMDINRIDVHVRRLGGAYGIKVSRESQIAVACSLVTKKLNRPCRFIQPLSTTMRAVGKRFSAAADFELGVNNSGVIQYMDYSIYEDNGHMTDEPIALKCTSVYNHCYEESRWNYKCYNTITDKPTNTWCRSPGTLEGIAMVEWMMEQISYEMSLDPIQVRLANLDTKKYDDLKDMIDTLKSDAKYTERKDAVHKFNEDNRWKKRGLRLAVLRWPPNGSQYFDVNISIYHGDGTVVITHGGIEMGQGINTKAAQICSYLFKIPLSKIKVKAQHTNIVPNCSETAGSITSQNVGVGVQRCCEDLLKKLDPIRLLLTSPTWEELISKAFGFNIDLQTHGFVSFADKQVYTVYGASLAEVEVDILTGESDVIRVDILQDVGRSVSPEIDVGQVEGAFIMGLGYWTSENLVYNKDTGEILTDRTWNYFVPQARDIPHDFRVYFKKNSYSDIAMFGAKASSEPPICMSVVIPFAIREALAAARLESGIPATDWFQIDGPYTVEKICMSAATKFEDFKFL